MDFTIPDELTALRWASCEPSRLFSMVAGSQTHLGHHGFALRNTISLSGLQSDRRKMGFKWAATPALVSCIMIQMIGLGLKIG